MQKWTVRAVWSVGCWLAMWPGMRAIAQEHRPPEKIVFDYIVTQTQTDTETGNTTYSNYYFTKDGKYAAISGQSDISLVIYEKDQPSWIVDDHRHTITAYTLPTMMGGFAGIAGAGGAGGRHKISLRPSGQTKKICGLPAVGYVAGDQGGQTVNFWYVQLNFDPGLIYKMGMGSYMGKKMEGRQLPGNDNSPLAVVLKNKNYFLAEVSDGSKKAIETTKIDKSNFVFISTGYKVKDMSYKSLGEMLKNAE
ncbi:hypothetical protein [Chitinophaga flava]|uniref:DUF4412 domain-containing protein n=1 Tax=Chitinophaga flava TaxID=2259036 RepID=A0A365Y0A5_9BACT|nr:hypothetical protein [Chitinophaga flava]RBL91758.1 hypothetical protein DF182_03895 [Chitinophaga flava]